LQLQAAGAGNNATVGRSVGRMVEVIAGRYRLGASIGAGGMAHVFEGHDDRLDRQVAIKLVPTAAIDPVVRERFRREARTSARFAHPNAVATYDAGEADGQLFLVMELVDGPSLARQLAAEGPLDMGQSLHVADAVLAALQAAHAAGIVHRDVKPANILLGRNGDVKLADFGIAKRLDDYSSELTGTGHFVGTPKYLAPEQLSGDPVTAATDVYATGVVLYEMVTGVAPFDAPTPLATAIAHQSAPVPDVRAARPDVPPHVAAAVSKAMAKDPADRFQTAAAMRVALAQPPPRPASVPSGRRSTISWIVPTVVLLAVGALAIAFGRDDDDPSSTVSSTVSSTAPLTGATAVVPPDTVAPSTAAPTPAPTNAPFTNPPTTAATIVAGSIEELVGLLDSNPDLFGERAEQLRRDLERVADGRGNDPERARRLLEDARRWVDDGELNADVLPLLDQLVGPLAADEDED